MFFDNQKFFEFEKKCRDRGIDVPIIPGLKPLTKAYQLQSLPRIFHLNLPGDLARSVYEVKEDKKKVREVGIEWSIQQAKELVAHGVPCLHYYTMGDTKTIHRIVKEAL
jgi:methylenetetrahydrofolate reductase (NADPH)